MTDTGDCSKEEGEEKALSLEMCRNSDGAVEAGGLQFIRDKERSGQARAVDVCT